MPSFRPGKTPVVPQGDAGELLAIGGDVVPGDEGAHAVAEQEIGEAGIPLLDQPGKGMLVLHHGAGALVAPVSPGAAGGGGFAVAHVVVCRHDEPGL